MRGLVAAALLALLGAGCAGGGSKGPVRELVVKVEPSVISYGVASQVTVLPAGDGHLKWVKGTVEFPGFKNVPEVKLNYSKKKKAWTRRLPPVPSLITIKPGSYTVKVWGEGKSGARYEGSAKVEFK